MTEFVISTTLTLNDVLASGHGRGNRYVIFTTLGAAIDSATTQPETLSIDANYPPLMTAMPIPLVTVGIQGVTSTAVHCQGGTSRTLTVSKPDGMLPGLAL